MSDDLYRCSCGKGFKTVQGLAGHKRFCTMVTQGGKENTDESLQRLSKLEKNCQENFQLCERLLIRMDKVEERTDDIERKISKLEGKIELLIGYVCPAGRNNVGVNSSRIFELTTQFSNLKSEIQANQGKFEREIKGWVWNVIPEHLRPKF